jgi:DeoR/GlpR family transcriptional regulator of sugar metabolism
MTCYDRFQSLLELLHKKQNMHIQDVAKQLGVSESAIRNHIIALESKTRVKRIYRGEIQNV